MTEFDPENVDLIWHTGEIEQVSYKAHFVREKGVLSQKFRRFDYGIR